MSLSSCHSEEHSDEESRTSCNQPRDPSLARSHDIPYLDIPYLNDIGRIRSFLRIRPIQFANYGFLPRGRGKPLPYGQAATFALPGTIVPRRGFCGRLIAAPTELWFGLIGIFSRSRLLYALPRTL